MVVRKALDQGPFGMREIAHDARVSYQSVRAWAAGIRIPEATNVRGLAQAFRKRARLLEKLAADLERAAGH